ncbi:MAG: LON peptidase substrate-binding domain-containing protein [Bacteroidales bacterium]|jgi:hypothetical protein|nr:LON peptidase substrate-binding domain-containing protein [Bacteroidales bacterium]
MTESNNIVSAIPMSLFLVPGEKMPIYIFEDRVKKIINDDKPEDTYFAIPYIVQSEMKPYGSLVRVKDLIKRNNDEDFVLTVECVSNFKLIGFKNGTDKNIPDSAEVLNIDNKATIQDKELIDILNSSKQKLNLQHISKVEKYTHLITDIIRCIGMTSIDKYNIIATKNIAQKQSALLKQLKMIMAIKYQSKNSC